MSKASTWNSSQPMSITQAFFIHLICGLGLAVGICVAHNVYSINLISHPSHTLCLILAVETPIVILLYSCFRQNPDKCSYLKAVVRAILGLSVGALISALGAIALGAPVGIQYLPKTINCSLLMSLFTCVPAASVFGSSWADWQRIFAHTKPNRSIEYMICIPAHTAIIGAWFGAWPMPLDWEKPWQEWPICVSYGAIVGYLVGIVASLALALVRGGQQHHKGD